MSGITTHVLDTNLGQPASGIAVGLERYEALSGAWTVINQSRTDSRGRLQILSTATQAPQCGLYRLRFDTSSRSPFFPEVIVQFVVSDEQEHYHVPLLLTQFGYTTYRGN